MATGRTDRQEGKGLLVNPSRLLALLVLGTIDFLADDNFWMIIGRERVEPRLHECRSKFPSLLRTNVVRLIALCKLY